MVFSGLPFLFFFFPAFLICYFAVPKNIKNYILLAFSLIFYAWGEPIYILLMLFSSGLNYISGLVLMKNGHRKLYFTISIILNLLLLGFFKYADLLIGTFNTITGLSIPLLNLALPIGISFYTFQTMSYTIDVYRGDCPPSHNFFTFMTYVSMFPQLIAGPIVRYTTVMQELRERTVTKDDFADGLLYMMRGLFKKVLLANSLGFLFDTVKAADFSSLSAGSAWLAIIAFNFQIYFDFSGYSDMAIGMGRMMGFKFPQNFNHPFIAVSVSDFWRRWHITLTTWFRDYLYIPLGGNRVSKLKHIRNILIVWLCTGIWHGASWNFLFWGLYFGIILLLEKFVYGKYLEKLPRIVKTLYTLFIVICGWVLFAFEDFAEGFSFLKAMFSAPLFDASFIYYLKNYALLLIIAIICSLPIREKIASFEAKKGVLPIITRCISHSGYIALFLVSVAMLVSDTYNPFLYFKF